MATSEDYVYMSLDEVIRDMKARKAAQEQNGIENNSPFFRQIPDFGFNKRPFKTPYQSKSCTNNRSNYINHMAKKRIQRARRTLDLRQKLITIRASKQGLDLRWKIVANMIAKLRQQAKSAEARERLHPYQHSNNSHFPNSDLAGMSNVTVCQPRVSRSTLNQIERLVGRLPPWMKPSNLAPVAPALPGGPPVHHQYQNKLSGVGPIRTGPRPAFSPNESFGEPVYQNNYVSPVSAQSFVHCQVPQTQTQVRCQPQIGNGYIVSQPRREEMPPLAYDPLPPTRPSFSSVDPIRVGPNRNSADHIEIVIADIEGEAPRVKRTLNERFTQ